MQGETERPVPGAGHAAFSGPFKFAGKLDFCRSTGDGPVQAAGWSSQAGTWAFPVWELPRRAGRAHKRARIYRGSATGLALKLSIGRRQGRWGATFDHIGTRAAAAASALPRASFTIAGGPALPRRARALNLLPVREIRSPPVAGGPDAAGGDRAACCSGNRPPPIDRKGRREQGGTWTRLEGEPPRRVRDTGLSALRGCSAPRAGCGSQSGCLGQEQLGG